MTTTVPDLLTNSHTAIAKADLYYAGSLIAANLPVSDGSISVDSTRATKRTCSLTIVDEREKLLPYIPKTPQDRLAPYGSELRISRGLLINGFYVYYLVGIFRIATAQPTDNGKGISIPITGYDRSRAISLGQLDAPYSIAAGTDTIAAIMSLLRVQTSGQSIGIQVETKTTGTIAALQVIDVGGDPWATIQSLATDIGCEAFFDVTGTLIIRDIPAPSNGKIKDTYQYGELSRFVDLTNALTDDPGYNGVIVIGQAPGLPIYTSQLWDTDQQSPTYYRGPYGKRPYIYRSTTIFNQAQADAAVQGLFNANIGITAQAQFDAIPNPLLDGGDVIQIEHDDLGVNDRYVIETLNIPLKQTDTMTVVCKKRRFG